MSFNESDLNMKNCINEAVKVGDDFVRLFYKTLEHRPHRVHHLYLDTAVVIWDGNPIVGTSLLQKYFEDLPSLTFNVVSMDSQMIPPQAVGHLKSFMITTAGTFRIAGSGTRGFSQNFIVTTDAGKWKVASDIFRSQVSPNQEVL